MIERIIKEKIILVTAQSHWLQQLGAVVTGLMLITLNNLAISEPHATKKMMLRGCVVWHTVEHLSFPGIKQIS